MMALKPGDRIGALTSGGDSPGMNAALHATARVAHALGLELVGIEDGYQGLLEGRTAALDLRALAEASRRGGTILGTARSKHFVTEEGQAQARSVLQKLSLRALLVIGGNGSLTGALRLADCVAVGGVPASIDNDLALTSMAIGVDTAMNTIVEACDRISDTANAHRRAFIVEVMGRDCGYLAMTAGIACGADAVLVRETAKDDAAIVDSVVQTIDAAFRDPRSNRRRVLVVKSEGVKLDSLELKRRVDARIGHLRDVDTRVTVLGHVVRGGTPSAFDRLLAARLANSAVRALAAGQSAFMAGWAGPGIERAACEYDPYVVLSPLDEVLRETARLLDGATPIAQWRRRIFEEVEGILSR